MLDYLTPLLGSCWLANTAVPLSNSCAYNKNVWPTLHAQPCRRQEISAGVKKSIWRGVARTNITLRDGRPPHGAGRSHHTDRQQRAGPAESDVQAAGKLLRMVLHFHNATSLTALFSASRGRARARFSRAGVAVDLACDLQGEFEVSVSLNNPLHSGYSIQICC